jgi:hypothetical protein
VVTQAFQTSSIPNLKIPNLKIPNLKIPNLKIPNLKNRMEQPDLGRGTWEREGRGDRPMGDRMSSP